MRALAIAIAVWLVAALSGCSGGGDQFTSARFSRSIPIGGADSDPLDVMVDFNDSLYVMAAGSWQVKKYTASGTFLENLIPFFAVTAGAFGPFQDIFVVSPGVGHVGAFDLAGNEQLQLEVALPAGILAYGVAVATDGAIYLWAIDTTTGPPEWNILCCSGGSCTVFIPGGPAAAIPVGEQQRGMAIDNRGELYYVDLDADRIRVIDPQSMQGRSIGSPGSGPGQLNDPCDVAVDAKRNVYVADTGNDRIQKFGPDGTLLFGFGGPGSGPGLFQSPQGVAIIESGQIVVADTGNDRVQVFQQF
jgi:hypothetical protein